MKYLYLHGFLSGPSSTKGQFLSRKIEEYGKELFQPDLNAGDFENLTISNQLAVVKKEIGFTKEKVVLIGSSLGAFIAVLTAEQSRQVDRLILIAPALDFVSRYFQNLTPDEMIRWKETGYITLNHYAYKMEKRLGYGIVEDAERFQDIQLNHPLNTLVIHGIYDEVVPLQVSVDYVQKNPRAILICFNSDHALVDQLENIWRYIETFLAL